MSVVQKLLSRIDAPLLAWRIASREVLQEFRRDYGVHPPALIPLWKEPSGSVIGYWIHPPLIKRAVCLVDHSGDTIMGAVSTTIEVACNLEQLMVEYIAGRIVSHGVDNDVRRLSDELGVTDIDHLIEIVEEFGEMPEGLRSHSAFENRVPLSMCEDDLSLYSGDFPYEGMEETRESLRKCCAYEVHSWYCEDEYRFRKHLKSFDKSPEWLRSENQLPIFEKLLSVEDYGGAWMSLNSLGWRVGDARSCLKRLALRSGCSMVEMLCDAWCEKPMNNECRY